MLIPKANAPDLADIPDNVKQGLKIQAVETIDEVLKLALVAPLMPLKPNNVIKTDEQGLRN